MTVETLDLGPGDLNVKMRRGDTRSFRVTLTENGTAMELPLSGWEAQIRAQAGAASEANPVLAEFWMDASGAQEGVIILTLDGEDTLNLPKKSKWDLQCTDGGVRTYLAGDLIIEEQVTQ